MQEENRSILSSLKEDVEELIPPLDAAQTATYGEGDERRRDSLGLLMGDLTMALVMLTNIDSEISATELELINEVRHMVFGDAIPALTSTNYIELFREFLELYPDKHLTLDHIPASIQLLRTYDQSYGTQYTEKAK